MFEPDVAAGAITKSGPPMRTKNQCGKMPQLPCFTPAYADGRITCRWPPFSSHMPRAAEKSRQIAAPKATTRRLQLITTMVVMMAMAAHEGDGGDSGNGSGNGDGDRGGDNSRGNKQGVATTAAAPATATAVASYIA